jgi:TolA-binding protein
MCLCAVLLAFPAGSGAAEQAAPPADFLGYLSKRDLRPFHLAELRRLALEEGSLSALRQYAGMLQDAGEFDRAAAFADSVKCRGEDIRAMADLIRAEGLLREGDYRAALETVTSLEAALPVRPALIEAEYLRARCLLELGRYEEARIHLAAVKSVAEDDLRASAVYYLALCDERLGDYDVAAAGYEVLHASGMPRGAAGLMRCRLRRGDVEGAQDVYREAIVRGIDLPDDEIEGLLKVAAWGAPDLWKDLMADLAADTTYTPTSVVAGELLRAAERGVDVRRYTDAFLAAGGPAELRFVRALSLGGRAGYDSLAVLAATGEKSRRPGYVMAMARMASLDESIPMPDEARLESLGGSYWDKGEPDELVYWLELLVDNDRAADAVARVGRCRTGLSVGFDDRALLNLAGLLDRAGAGAEALGIYEEVAGSPVPSAAAFAGEKGVYMMRLTPPEREDLSSVVEQVATGGRSNLELAEVFDKRLGDFAKAADYYQRALKDTEDADERDRIRLKAAMALSNDFLKTGNAGSRDKALNLAAVLAASGAVSARDVILLLKASTDWLSLDLFRCTETARQIAAREHLDDQEAYDLSRMLFRLYERGDAQAYELCLAALERLLGSDTAAAIREKAAFLDARVRLEASDYAGALERFGACLKTARQSTLKRLCNMGVGDCYVGSGAIEQGLKAYGEAGDSPIVSLKKARCCQLLGRYDDACTSAAEVQDHYTPPEVSAAARILRGLCRPGESGLPSGAREFYFPHYDYLGLYRDFREYLPLVEACDLSLSGYDGLAARVLKDFTERQLEGVHCQILLSGYDPAGPEHAEFYRALQVRLAADCKDAFDAYANLRLKALLECSSESDDTCGRAAGLFKSRYPAARQDAAGIDAVRATSLYRDMYVGKADAIADSLFKSGDRSELLAEAVYRKGVSFLLEKALDEARQTFLIMNDCFPASRLYPDVCFKLGTTYYLMEAYDSSAVFFRLAAEEGRVDLMEDALFNLGLALEESGDLEAASKSFSDLAMRFPFSERFERALMRSAYCLDKSDRPLQALGDYRTLLDYSTSPATRAEAGFWMGEALAGAGHSVEAALEFMRTGFLYPGQEAWAGTARFRAGMECESAGLKEAAKLIYSENVSTFGRTSTWGKASYDRLVELIGEG